ncbi:MAG TPA: 1,4-dihydroxy-2-naphthoate polyprenyltransferase [Actinomycetota bacterium]|jgi:1,4-dihydroxy-2-naphthoate octaprenyltransferase|nr:1,4-dihydroxy-2-naphthoate polyprenyltransferase [Actinomycetota bacterium]
MNLWVQGARPRTLVAAVCPVLVGTAAAAAEGPVVAWRAAAALVVAVALQIGVNYANDYSDGLRGADTPDRLGPVRLTATGLAAPAAVRRAAAIAFGVAAAAGLALAVAVDLRLLLVGVAAIAAAVLYTGGPRPYGYAGFGEVAVLAFFGVVATCGSAYVQLERVPAVAVAASLVVGLGAVAILLANNVRDIEGDRLAGKRTLAVRLGRPRARDLYTAVVAAMFAAAALLGLARPPVLVTLAALPLAVAPVRLVRTRGDGPGLIAALGATARLQLAVSLLLAAGLWLS